jgi:glucosamine--fructose-6-phosphate aminotransferase (isomerizing)
MSSSIGMGHTRWATHGVPNDINAHPHLSNNGNIAIVHNGIIENYLTLKKELIRKGYSFKSETDTEVLVNFIEDIHNNLGGPLEESVRIAMQRVIGAYGLVILSKKEPNKLIAIRKGSPLCIGKGEDEFFIGSDPSPFLEHTKEVIYLNDDEIAVLKKDGLDIFNFQNIPQNPYIQYLDMELEAIEKGNYEHFMLKEIHEQPRSLKDCMRGRINLQSNEIKLGGLNRYVKQLYQAKRIIFTACGTSFYAASVAEYLIEELCRIPVEVEYASEFRYRNPVIYNDDVVIAISQSGETADTLVAVEMAKSLGATVFGVCNAVGSSIPRATHEGVYTHAGPEIGVASTKAFTAQVIVLAMIALKIARHRNTIDNQRYLALIHELERIPELVQIILNENSRIKALASKYWLASNFLYLGRGYNFPVALEGALKLKEISYIHAEGYPAAEMKHGPIALIDSDMPVVVIALKDNTYEKIISNIQEIKSRKGKVIAIISKGDELVKGMVDDYIEIPQVIECLSPLLTVVPLQIMAYHIGILKGCNVDQPRNLAKSVTVE